MTNAPQRDMNDNTCTSTAGAHAVTCDCGYPVLAIGSQLHERAPLPPWHRCTDGRDIDRNAISACEQHAGARGHCHLHFNARGFHPLDHRMVS